MEKPGELYQEALNRWGVSYQVDMCIEEMARLIKAFLNLRRCDEHDPGRRIGGQEAKAIYYVKVHQELGNVELMLAQMREIFSSNQIDHYKKIALRDLEKTLNEGRR